MGCSRGVVYGTAQKELRNFKKDIRGIKRIIKGLKKSYERTKNKTAKLNPEFRRQRFGNDLHYSAWPMRVYRRGDIKV